MHVILLLSLIAGTSVDRDPIPWQPDEHRALADSAFRIVMRDLGASVPHGPASPEAVLDATTVVWHDLNFGRLTERFARDDGAASRFQTAGESVYQQLGQLSAGDIEAFWNLASSRSEGAATNDPVIPNEGNVVANFLVSHLAALHFARIAASSQPAAPGAFRSMLVYEAIAQGLLADAHASGHLLVPRHDALQALHPVNNRRAHDYYSTEGVFVVNGRFQAWEAFGDGLLTWYARSYRQVLEAGVSSLRELFLVYFATKGSMPSRLDEWLGSMTDGPVGSVTDDWLEWNDGPAYYESGIGLPSLNYVPMPVSATWSIRSEARDEHGTRIRRQYPQFREAGYHDPDLLSVVEERLYSKSAFPSRFLPTEFGAARDLATVADSSRDAASVEYVQVHSLPADFAGLQVEVGAGALTDDEKSVPAISARIGYGIAENILVASHLSVNAGVTMPLEDRRVTPATITAGLNPGGLPIRLEAGYATTADDLFSESAPALAVACGLTSQVLGFTYIGVSVRLRYGIMLFDDIVHSTSIQVAFY
ncbi:MAG: hypothetical protein WBW88_05660 [Rhodothermales bacterium]